MALLETLQDNFDNNSFDTAKWSKNEAGGATVTEQNQQLEFAGGSGQSAFVDSVATYTLENSYAFVRFTNYTSLDSARLYVLNADGDYYHIIIGVTGTLRFFRNIGGTPTMIGSSLTYDAATHAWLRIRMSTSGNTIYGDTAPLSGADPPIGVNWVNRWSESVHASFNPAAVVARMEFFPGAAARVGYFDGFNTGTVASSEDATHFPANLSLRAWNQ